MVASTHRFQEYVKVWSFNNNKDGLSIKSVFTGHEGYVSAVCFTPDDKYVVCGAGAEEALTLTGAGIRFWRIEDRRCAKAIITNETVSALSYSPDGQRLLVRDQWWIFIQSLDPELDDENEDLEGDVDSAAFGF